MQIHSFTHWHTQRYIYFLLDCFYILNINITHRASPWGREGDSPPPPLPRKKSSLLIRSSDIKIWMIIWQATSQPLIQGTYRHYFSPSGLQEIYFLYFLETRHFFFVLTTSTFSHQDRMTPPPKKKINTFIHLIAVVLEGGRHHNSNDPANSTGPVFSTFQDSVLANRFPWIPP